ncbi:MAG TPA: DNA repair protein RecN [Candidatus Limnocylindrales bacterium]|nr:DNA repair protein RecN [Candidatus Limnocylindrales bacterium]
MLQEIRIQNFAIIDRLELSFAPGLNVITGETGAGKSIIVDAVELLLGGKADPSMVRAGAERALIEGVFVIDGRSAMALQPILEREELNAGESLDELVISRELRANGRSSARLNGVTVNLELLAEIGEKLVDVHGQSAHLSLLKPASHIDLLDRYAELMEARAAMAALVGKVGAARREMVRLQQDEAQMKRRAERLAHEIEEIEAAALTPGEDETLMAERSRLGNSEQLAQFSAEAVHLLYGDEDLPEQSGAVDQVLQACALLEKLARIDAALTASYSLSQQVAGQIEELATTLHRYLNHVEYNPARLDEVQERLELIRTLQRRYNAPAIVQVLEYAETARAELALLEHSEERLVELAGEEDKLLHLIGELGGRITRLRQNAARQLAQGIIRELGDLRMVSARFEVEITHSDDPRGAFVGDRRLAFSDTGLDTVEFLLSANPGEPLRPLARVASGGEAARIMLALKRVLTRADQTPTLIFDEIDQGIGGRVGSVVGEKLWGLTDDHQVMVVTHLAQLASYADRHYRVLKQVDHGRTHTLILPLEGYDQRVEELAAMLGTVNEPGYQSARELLTEAAGYKQQSQG